MFQTTIWHKKKNHFNISKINFFKDRLYNYVVRRPMVGKSADLQMQWYAHEAERVKYTSANVANVSYHILNDDFVFYS